MANFYQKFIKRILANDKTNFEYFQKGVIFWMERGAIEVLRTWKKKSHLPLCWRSQTFTKPFEVHTNANDFTIREFHMQNGHPMAFEYKKLCDG
jgi:hypothetical protein